MADMFYKKGNKGQVSLEVIILIGVLIAVAIVLAVILFDFTNKTNEATTKTVKGTDDVVDNFLGDLNSWDSNISDLNIASMPVANPVAGIYNTPINVILSTTTSDANIFYTLDGTSPTSTNTKYTGPIPVAISTTLKAIAISDGMINSSILTAVYTIIPPDQVAMPTASPDGGNYSSAQTVTLASTTINAEIYYTTNGNTPTTGDTLYNGVGVPINSSTTLKAIAVKTGMIDSDVMVEDYIINIVVQLSKPTATPDSGSYSNFVDVNLSASSGATIYYTLDGTIPTTGSYTYGLPIHLVSNTNLKAIAVKTGYLDSDIMSKDYNVYLSLNDLFTLSPGINGLYSSTYGVFSGLPSSITITKYSIGLHDTNIPMDNNISFTQGQTKDLNLGIINSTSTIKLYLSDGNIITKTATNTNNGPASGDCPTGFIPVPGNSIYNTISGTYLNKKGFCVAKYEMKIDVNDDGIGDEVSTCQYSTRRIWNNATPSCNYNPGSREVVSSYSGYALGNINTATARAACSSMGGNYHLITNNEWMTLARNIEIVPSNWSGGSIGSGYIYSGHNDTAPGYVLNADTNDLNGYYLTGQITGNQKRTLTLTNGSVIWDLAGNIWEYTDNQVTRENQPDGFTNSHVPDNTANFFNYSFTTVGGISKYITDKNLGDTTFKYNDLFLASSSLYNVNHGVGTIYTYSWYTTSTSSSFTRGGYYGSVSYAGILGLSLQNTSTTSVIYGGLRCVYIP